MAELKCEPSAAAAKAGAEGWRKRFCAYLRKHWHGYVFIAPVMLGILFFTLVPMLQSLYYSFFRYYNVMSPPSGFGLYNFKRMFSFDNDFAQALKVTGIYTVVSIPLMMVLSFLLALLLNQKFRGIGIFRVLIYLPVILPVTVSGIVWRNFTDVDFGLANALLEAVGLPRFSFFESASTSMFSLIFFGLWGLGGGMILWLSALKNVPPALYEAAEIDGANAWTRLVKITVPMCTPMIFYNLIMNIINALQVFGSVYTLTGGSTGADNSLLFYLMKVYNDAFNIQGKTMGYACAESWILFLIIAALTALVFKTSKWVFYGEES